MTRSKKPGVVFGVKYADQIAAIKQVLISVPEKHHLAVLSRITTRSFSVKEKEYVAAVASMPTGARASDVARITGASERNVAQYLQRGFARGLLERPAFGLYKVAPKKRKR